MTNDGAPERSVAVETLRASLDECLADVAAGATVVVTRNGVPVANLVPADSAATLAREVSAVCQAAPVQPATALLRLMGTSATRSVLGVFVTEPDRPIHQREVARRASVGLRSAQLALERLESLGLVQSERDGNRRYYRADRTSRFEELRALLSRELGLAEVIARALTPLLSRIEQAFIFGSAASGEDKVGSDIDLLVVGDTAADELVEPIAQAQRELGREIALVTYSCSEFASRREARNHFLSATLAGPRVQVIGARGDT